MKRRLQKTVRAEADIEKIALWIARDNENAAAKWLDDLDQRFLVIADTPGIGTQRDDLHRGIRSYAFGSYLIFFKLTRSTVLILRVIHGARHYRPFFKQS